jgi:diguanylate cyclase (GGDEF)-like protein/PAS domain S-box-containing protein
MNPEKLPAARRVRRQPSKSTGIRRHMNPGKPPPPGDPSEEVSALIATLHENVQRLEELTAGEVDTVADREGRTFLLRHSQEQLRRIQAAKQAAILNALPAHIALLDTQGLIISVNEAWRRFSRTNAIQGPGVGIGLNYLEICDHVRGDGSSEAHQVAEGIRSVLGGGVKSFSIEYPCHSPTEQRWFLLTVTPLGDDHPNGAVVMHLNITERKRVEEALRTTEREQRQLAEQLGIERSRLVAAQRVAKVGSWETDMATMSVIWSDETHRIFETDPATFRPTRQDFVKLVHPEDRAGVDEAFGRSLAQRVACTTEYRLLLPDGRIKFVEELWQVLFDKQGKPIRAIGTCQDITERKRIEEETHETKNFLASIFDNIPNSIFVKDARDLQFLRVNTACEKLTGYAEEEFLGKSDYDFFPKDQADFFVAKDRETLASKQRVFIVEETITSRDGTRKLLQTKKFAILDKDGHPQYLLGMSEDITERKQSERLLRESEAKYRHLIEQADDGIFISDKQGNFVLVNSRGCELLGYTEDELLGMNGNLTYLEEERELHAGRMRAVGAGKTLRFERVTRRKDGSTFPVEVSLKMLDNGTVQVIFHDITERRSQEKKISRLSRLHAVLSGINAAIVRIRDRRELFQEACRIIVEHGQFTLGWIAVLDHATGKLTAVAQAGLPENSAGGDFFNGSVGLVPAGIAEVALREKHSAADNAIEDAPGVMNTGQEPDTLIVRRAAIKLGAKSVIVLPLVVEKETFGILTLYAPERNFFDDEEIKLLNGLAGDISFGLEFIAKEEKVDYLAYYDVLTGLANRSLFLERVAQYICSAVSGGHRLAVFFLDLERFRNINDSLGRPAGDALLKQVAEFLSRDVADANLLARVGADHFAIVLPALKQEGNVARLLDKKIRAFLDHPFRLNDTEFRIPVKVGVALFPDDGADADTLFKNAEAALKKAKASGERYLFYTQGMTETVAGNLTLENQLRQALDKSEFVLHYQPKVNLVSGKLTGAEALIRWDDPRTGLVPPARFIPILEETGLIYDVGRWALRKAIEDYLRWRAAGLAAVRIAVNVSPLQLRHRGFIADIKEAIGIDALAVAGLELEITESLIMEDIKHSIASLQAIRAMGVTIAIDDFGTGFSSLSYLAKLPVDTLKIDRSFVTDMTAGPEGLALVSTIINLAHSLKLKVVAEGVETEEQSRLLRLLDCDEMQGYLFSRPVPGEVFETRFLTPPPAA